MKDFMCFNVVWNRLGNKDKTTKNDVFQLFSNGTYKKETFEEYEELLNNYLDETYGYYTSEQKVNTHNKKTILPFYNSLLSEYVDRFTKGIGSLECANKISLAEKYEGVTPFNYKSYFNQNEQKVIESFVFEKEENKGIRIENDTEYRICP